MLGNFNSTKMPKKPFSARPTDFPEAETSSPGFTKEIDHNSTQSKPAVQHSQSDYLLVQVRSFVGFCLRKIIFGFY